MPFTLLQCSHFLNRACTSTRPYHCFLFSVLHALTSPFQPILAVFSPFSFPVSLLSYPYFLWYCNWEQIDLPGFTLFLYSLSPSSSILPFHCLQWIAILYHSTSSVCRILIPLETTSIYVPPELFIPASSTLVVPQSNKGNACGSWLYKQVQAWCVDVSCSDACVAPPRLQENWLDNCSEIMQEFSEIIIA